MKVALGCQGRFHFFELARQMEHLGYLQQLYTGYPRFKITDLPRRKISTLPYLMTSYMLLGRLGVSANASSMRYLSYAALTSFDTWVARSLTECDVFHWLSGAGTKSHQVARERFGALAVCDRASSHIAYQQELMEAEFDRFGMKYSAADPRVVDRELAEYESADVIVVPSGFAKRSFVGKNFSNEKVRIVPFGVNLDLFKQLAKRDEIFRVLFVGQVGLRKGIPDLLEALGNLRLPKFELCLAGTILPEARSFLKQYEDKFRYLGVIPRDQLPSIYSNASVFVLASVEEGLAYVQAEAMACGLPVIATVNSGAEDLFRDGVEGFILPIHDPDAIREKVLSLYRDPSLLVEMSRAALARVKAIGGWNDYGERVERTYRNMN
jgi:starch synthase